MSAILQSVDRCDACGSQAFVRAAKDGHVLLFCGHHGARHRARLVAEGWLIIDERDRIEGEQRAAAVV